MRLIRKGDDPATMALMLLAVGTMGATLVTMLAVPKPDIRSLERRFKSREYSTQNLVDKASDNLKKRRATVVTQTWNVPEQQVGPAALASATRLVNRNKLNLISFRPQRRGEDGSFVQLPYLLTVDGSYPAVLSLVKSLENPNTKLAVSLVQVTSADAGSDRVTASIGLVAYLTPKESTPNG
ncbi:MAG TPA: type 4a pilus biogenesis protein PilO [Fimbriimonas sp.]